MSLKDRAVELVLRARNLLSRDTDQAAESVRDLGEGAEHLRDQLRGLEDQKQLVQQFQQSTKATERARQQWERAEQQVARLSQEIEESGEASDYQRQRLAQAQRVAGQAEASYQQQAESVTRLSEDLRAAGISTENLSDEQIRIARETTQARRALADYNETVADGDGRLRAFGKRLAAGAVSFAKWAAAGAAAGAALSVGLITRYTASQAQLATQLDNTSEALGVNAQRLQAYQYAFQRVGINADKTGSILKDVADKIGDYAATGGGEAAELFENLNISIEELQRLAPDQQLLAIGEALSQVQSRGEQVFFLEALADDASLLLPLLENNAAGLRELADEANNVGAIYSPEDLERLRETNHAVERLQGRFQGLRNRLLGELAPAVTEVADQFDELLEDNPGLVDDLATAFGGLLRQTGDWMQYIVTNREKVGGALQSLIDTAQFLGNTFTAVFRGIQMVIAGVLAGAAQAYSHVRNLMESTAGLLNKLGIVSDETLARMRAHSEAAQQAVRDLETQTVEYGRQALQAGRDAVTAFDNSGAAAKRAAAAASEAAEQNEKISAWAVAGALSVARAAEENAQRQTQLRDEIRATELEIAKYQQRLNDDPSGEYARKVQELEGKLGDLKLELASVTREAGANSRAMEAAADAIGLTLEELRTGVSDAAREAIEGFDTLARSGKLTGEQLQDAFQATWENLDSPEAREAFLDNIREMVEDGVEGAGKWLAAWQEAFQGLEDGSTGAADALKKVSDAAKEAAESQEENAESGRSVRLSLGQIQRAAAGAAGGVRAAWKAVAQQAREAAAEEGRAADSSRDHAEAVDEQTRAMEEAERASQRLNDSLESSIASMREQLAQLEGDQARVQELQYDRQKLELQQQLNEAREVGDAEAQRSAREALRLADQIHQKRLDNIRQEARERERQAEDEARSQPQPSGAARSAMPRQGPQVAQPTRRIEVLVRAETGNARVYVDDDRNAEALITALGRDARRT
ncbi:hypothetical protein [Halomonas cerina]|uniref:Uncharacterized protein n=1 Tax=Halomonas cerina TaxID=447424 RepID=A0A839VHE9_9GAMM|nr:hypothetical protein [Halomonas cerina]MBB3192044.1 hypothetical protein [Halomonas cerina]